MSENWTSGKLGDFITLQRGYDLPSYERETGTIPVVTSSGITDTHSKAKAKSPGVIMGRYGTIGQIYYVETDYWPHNTSLYVKDFKSNHPHFIYYFLKTLHYQAHNDKTSVPGLNRNDLHLIEVRIPPLREQRAIAHILGSLDDKIELNRRMNSTLEATARALFKSWFVDFDPVHYKARGEQPPGMDAQTAALFPDSFEDSELGPIPAGWKLCRIGEIAQVKGGKRLPKDRNLVDFVTEHAYLRVKDFTEWGIDRSDIKYLDDETHQTVRRYIITNDDIYISIAGTIGRVGIVPPDLSGANLTENAAKICNIAPVVNKYYLLHFLQSSEGQAQIASKVVGSTQPKLALFRIEELLVIIPSPYLMQVAAEFFEENGRLINNLQSQNSNLSQIRDTLLPKLVSGELRVWDMEKEQK